MPRTLITNDPAEVEQLLARTGTPILDKALTGGVQQTMRPGRVERR